MSLHWVNEWGRGMLDLSVLNVTVSRRDLMVVVLGLGVGVRW